MEAVRQIAGLDFSKSQFTASNASGANDVIMSLRFQNVLTAAIFLHAGADLFSAADIALHHSVSLPLSDVMGHYGEAGNRGNLISRARSPGLLPAACKGLQSLYGVEGVSAGG